jgi:DNA-binding protein YbaB
MLQDLVVAAVNDALESSRRLAEQKMAAATGGLGGGLGGLLGGR